MKMMNPLSDINPGRAIWAGSLVMGTVAVYPVHGRQNVPGQLEHAVRRGERFHLVRKGRVVKYQGEEKKRRIHPFFFFKYTFRKCPPLC